MATFDPYSPETVYALKGNIKAPAGNVAATIAALAQTRINDALTNPLLFSGDTQATVTVSATDVKIANP